MEAPTPKPKIAGEEARTPLYPAEVYYHATLVKLDGQPLYARGVLPTIHHSLTYAMWYLYWMSQLEHRGQSPGLYLYELHEAGRYLVPQGNGLFSVSEIGSIPYDDRSEGVLLEAPALFRKDWKWDGRLTYLPARCLQRVSAHTVRQRVDREEWLTLCRNAASPPLLLPFQV